MISSHRLTRHFVVVALAAILTTAWLAAQGNRALRGRVFDPKGAVIVGATVVLVDPQGGEKTTRTSNQGQYVFPNLPPGIYTLRVSASGFAPYEHLAEIPAVGKDPVEVDVRLQVAVERQEVTVTSDAERLSLSGENNAGAIVLKGDDLDALPDDPDELADALQALAGPSAGPDGAQFYIDGFTGGRLPPKSSIREIRINQNPFSAEFERMGFGRIQIFTKPGTDRFQGQAFFSFNDESLNSRNPYAPSRAPFQARRFGGEVSGPLIAKKASFFIDFERRELDENAVINARILDSNLNPIPFSQAVVTPQRRTTVSPRFEFKISERNTLIARYGYSTSADSNEGIGEFSLLSRAYDASRDEHEFSITETAILSEHVINETRFQLELNKRTREGDNSVPTIRVLDAFYGGGSQVGLSETDESEWELQNATSWVVGRNSLKIGGRVRGIRLSDISRSNFGGTFTFGGGFAAQLDPSNQPVLGPDGLPVLVPISSLERYRRTLLLQNLGFSLQDIRRLGGGATQFSIAGGDPEADVQQIEAGIFINNDFRIRPDLMLSLGLRYEGQTNIDDKLDLAPRLSFAWSPRMKAGQRPKTVIRGGSGIFYDRISQRLTLEADRFNGLKQQQYIVSNPDFFPNVPSVAELAAAARPLAIYRLDTELNAPYSIQSAISVERQLLAGFTATVSYVNTRRVHEIRSRNVNAPLPGTNVRPLGETGNVFLYQSDGISKQNQLIIGFNNRFGRSFTLFGNYSYGRWNTNAANGPGLPFDPYDFGNEWGRASGDVRHRFFFGGSIMLPWQVRLNPFVIATSGRPFNITTGRDTNADTLFTERPALATDLTKPGVIITPYGAFDPNPGPGQPIILRNYGEGPGFLLTRLRLSKTFPFGKRPEADAASLQGGPPQGMWAGGRMEGGRGGGPGGRGGRGGFGGSGGEGNGRYNLTFSIEVSNLLNNTNPGPVIGNLTSPLFGVSNSALSGFGFRGPGDGGMSAAGNRRIELQMRFSF